MMKSGQKLVVTGMFGGLTAVAVAASGAFACTATANVKINVDGAGQNRPPLRAGEMYRFTVNSFEEAVKLKDPVTGEVVMRDGKVQYADPKMIVVSLIDPYSGATLKVGESPGTSEFSQDIIIPTTAWNSSGAESSAYKLVAIQTSNAGAVNSANASIFLFGGTPVPEVLPPGQPPVNPGDPKPPVTLPVLSPQQVAAPPAGSLAQTQPPKLSVATVAADGSTPAAGQQGGTAPAGVAANPLQSVTVTPPMPPDVQRPPLATELWSGLSADTTPSLLDPAAVAPPSRGVPASGVALLGTGVLALAGAALGATRRRLAVARVTRRR